MFAASLEALCELAPWGHRMVTTATALALALSSTHWVIDRVHDHTTNMWTDAKPATAASFS